MSSTFRIIATPGPVRRPASALAVCLLLALTSTPFAQPRDALEEVLELRGYAQIGGEMQFSIYNKESDRSEWLRLEERREGYEITSYDPDNRLIVVRYRNREGTLHLQGSRIARYTSPAPVSPPSGEGRGTNSDDRPVANASSPDRGERRQADRREPSAERGGSAPGDAGERTEVAGGFGNLGGVPASGSPPSRSPTPPGNDDPPDPTPPSSPGNGDSGSADDDWWRSPGEPPPAPSGPRPEYSPEDQ